MIGMPRNTEPMDPAADTTCHADQSISGDIIVHLFRIVGNITIVNSNHHPRPTPALPLRTAKTHQQELTILNYTNTNNTKHIHTDTNTAH
jgi:hypothetical protein